MSRVTESPCCGSFGLYLIRFLIIIGFLLSFIGFICILVGGDQLYSVDYDQLQSDSLGTTSSGYKHDLDSFVSCMSKRDAIWGNESFTGTFDKYYADENARNWKVAECIAINGKGAFIGVVAVTGVIMFFAAIITIVYWWKDKKYLFYFAFSLSTLVVFLLLTIFSMAGYNTGDFINSFIYCDKDSMTVEDYNAMVAAVGSNPYFNDYTCLTGRDRSDITIPGSAAKNTDLEAGIFFVRQLNTLYAGCGLGIFSMLIYIGIFSFYPPF